MTRENEMQTLKNILTIILGMFGLLVLSVALILLGIFLFSIDLPSPPEGFWWFLIGVFVAACLLDSKKPNNFE
jgi:hypothetical protein